MSYESICTCFGFVGILLIFTVLLRWIIKRINLVKQLTDENSAIIKIKDDLIIASEDFKVVNIYSRLLKNYKNVREIRVNYEYSVNKSRRCKVKILFAYNNPKGNRVFDYFEDFWLINKKKFQDLAKWRKS